MKRTLTSVALCSLFLAACGGAGSATGSTAAPAGSPAVGASPGAGAKPGSASAAAPGSPAAATFDGTLLIGAPMSLTGSTANEGKLTQQGYDLWVDMANAKGGINVGGKHYKAQIKYYDDQSKQDQSALLTDKLISQDKVAFMLGPYGTAPVFAASVISEKAKMPMVDVGGAAETIFNRNFKYIFGVLSPGTKYLTGVIDAWNSQNPKPEKLAILAANDAFSLEVAKAAHDYADSKGLQVVYDQNYPPDTKDLSSALNQVKAAGADVLLGSGHLDDSLVLMKQVKSLGLNFKGIGLSVGPSTPEFHNALAADSEYVFSGVQWVPEQKDTGPVIGSAQDYTNAFKQKYNILPEYHNAEATAGGLALQLAIEKAGSLDKDKVRDTLAALDQETFFGRIKFDSRGLNEDKPMIVIQLQKGGALIPVYPDAAATGKILWPAPAWNQR